MFSLAQTAKTRGKYRLGSPGQGKDGKISARHICKKTNCFHIKGHGRQDIFLHQRSKFMKATPCFRLYTCNNLTELGRAYSKARREHPENFRNPDFFAEETICVATQGMGTWLEHFLVKEDHVVAGSRTRFIRNVIDEILAKFMANESNYKPDLFGEEVLIWRIFRILGELSARPEETFSAITSYLAADGPEGDNAAVRRYQLARKLSQLYYDYMAFVPEKLHPELAREMGFRDADISVTDGNRWQLELWQRLCLDIDGKTPVISPAAALLRFLRPDSTIDKAKFGPVTFFGISAMAPYFLLILKKLSTAVPVNFFYLNHCDELWDEVKSDWEKRHSVEQELDGQFDNTLLGNFGVQGRQFFKVVLDNSDDIYVKELSRGVKEQWEAFDYARTAPQTAEPLPLLKEIQNCIKLNTNHPADNPLPQPQDDSLTIHNCFNELREVEALHDSLLKLISEYKNAGRHLDLNDIIVMAPDISRFAPAIHSVFGRGILKSKYCISDRSFKSANLLADTFLDLMKLSKTHFEISKINQLLDSAPLRKKFGFDEESLPLLRDWFRKAGIRWGRSRNDRLEQGCFEEYSWEFGLDRMMLKLALDCDENYGILQPVDYSTGKDNQRILEGLLRFYHELKDFTNEILQSDGLGKTAVEWCDFLLEKRSLFFQADSESALEYSLLGKSFTDMKDALVAAGFAKLEEKLPFAVVLSALEAILELPAKGEPFLNGKITFCSLLPMRGIPCKIIAILGMDTGEFPRANDATAFNLINRGPDGTPQGGILLKYYDRSRNLEDRFIFLEALMSARDYLMIFYKGQDDQTLDELVAAAPVSELTSYIRLLRHLPERGNDSWPLVNHFLNAFDPKSFATSPQPAPTSRTAPANRRHSVEHQASDYTGALLRPFSYDKQMAAVAALNTGTGAEPVSRSKFWLDAYKLPMPQNLPRGWKCGGNITIALDDLIRFFRNPSERYVMSRLGFPRANWEQEMLSDYEPFRLDSLSSYQLKQLLAAEQKELDEFRPLSVANYRMKNLYATSRGSFNMPIGKMGHIEFVNQQLNSWIKNDEFRREWRAQEASPDEEFQIRLGKVFAGLDGSSSLALAECLAGHAPDARAADEDVLNSFGDTLPYFNVTVTGTFKYFRNEDNAGGTRAGLRQWLASDNLTGRRFLPVMLQHLLLRAKNADADFNSKIMLNSSDEKIINLSTVTALQESVSGRVHHFLNDLRTYCQCLEDDESSEEIIERMRDALQAENTAIQARLAGKLQDFSESFRHSSPDILACYDELCRQLDEIAEPARLKGVYNTFRKAFSRELWSSENHVQSPLLLCEQLVENIRKIQDSEFFDKIKNKATLPEGLKALARNLQSYFPEFCQCHEEIASAITESAGRIKAQAEELLAAANDGNTCEASLETLRELKENMASYLGITGDLKPEICLLKQLCSLYFFGHFYPLPFFPEASFKISNPNGRSSDYAKILQDELSDVSTQQLFGNWLGEQNLAPQENNLLKNVAKSVYAGFMQEED